MLSKNYFEVLRDEKDSYFPESKNLNNQLIISEVNNPIDNYIDPADFLDSSVSSAYEPSWNEDFNPAEFWNSNGNVHNIGHGSWHFDILNDPFCITLEDAPWIV